MIVLASIPRCGSTYLARSIAGLPQSGGAPDGGFRQYGIVKTHRPPGEVEGIEDAERAILLHGDVAAAVVSTQENRHDPVHFANCGVEYAPDVDLLADDYLGYTALLFGWLDPPLPTLFVRYEAMQRPKVRRELEEWTDREVEWLPWRERRTRPTDRQAVEVYLSYEHLIHAVEALPDTVVATSGNLYPRAKT